MRKQLGLFGTLLIGSALLHGCADTMGPGLAPADEAALSRGMPAHAVDADGRKLSGVAIEWRSTAESVATITPQGVVIAVGAGTAELEAHAGDVKASIAIDVQGEPVASIEVSPQDPAPVAIGATVRIAVSMYDRLHAPISDPRDIAFASSDESVMTVSDDGVARAIAASVICRRCEICLRIERDRSACSMIRSTSSRAAATSTGSW